MTRTRQARFGDLTESWDSVDETKTESPQSTEDTQQDGDYFARPAPRSSDRSSTTRSSGRLSRHAPREEDEADQTPTRNAPRERSNRQIREPELMMPSSPDGAPRRTKDASASAKLRAQTPHFRLNERSLTSDVGKHNNMRAQTPHFRAAQRSLTSDAGIFKRGGPRTQDDNSDNSDEDEFESETYTDKQTRANTAANAAEWPQSVFANILRPLLSYCADVLGLALNNLKPLLGYILLAYMLAGGIIFGVGFLHNSVNSALTPICRIPGARLLHLPFCPSASAKAIQGPAEFDRLVEVQSAFDDVLSETAIGASLPLDMKRSEASIRDLKHVVQYSSLPSRNELVFEFGGFVDTARQASQDLSRFNSRIGRALDHILSTNRWTLSVIEGVDSKEDSQGSVSRWVGKNLNIFAPFQPVALSRDLLLDQYLRHTSAVEEQILSLISEAQSLLTILDNLDGRLDVIASIATRDGLKAEGNKEELFAHLWTKLGGNRQSVAKLEYQINLLKQVGQYRRLAWAHITTTMVKLQGIRDNLEDLRDRVALPEILGTNKVPLEVHIESINLGIERLEKQRENSRQVEKESHARVLAKVEQDGRLLDGKSEL